MVHIHFVGFGFHLRPTVRHGGGGMMMVRVKEQRLQPTEQ